MTITLGWWIAPLVMTVLVFAWRAYMHKDDGPSFGGYSAIGAGIGAALTLLAAVVVSLIAWLIWALLT